MGVEKLMSLCLLLVSLVAGAKAHNDDEPITVLKIHLAKMPVVPVAGQRIDVWRQDSHNGDWQRVSDDNDRIRPCTTVSGRTNKGIKAAVQEGKASLIFTEKTGLSSGHANQDRVVVIQLLHNNTHEENCEYYERDKYLRILWAAVPASSRPHVGQEFTIEYLTADGQQKIVKETVEDTELIYLREELSMSNNSSFKVVFHKVENLSVGEQEPPLNQDGPVKPNVVVLQKNWFERTQTTFNESLINDD